MRRTKIIVTVGPASEKPQILERLIKAGMDVARLNFSHGSHQEHIQRIQLIRKIAQKLDRPITIIQDLQGPKVRVATLPNNQITLKEGTIVTLTPAERYPSQPDTIPIDYSGLAGDVAPGMRILMDDGLLELNVIAVDPPNVKARVVRGGILKSRKSVNVPDAPLNLPSVTQKDLSDLEVGIKCKVDYIALSFVRDVNDLRNLRTILAAKGSSIPIIAKIEKPQALNHLREIIEESDAVMVARGDLGVELSPERVPIAQKQIIKLCNQVGKPVITATQMLESMVSNPVPTRAETSDVANAIMDGTDAIMLSAETSIGQYPVEAVKMMDRIARQIEAIAEFKTYPPSQFTPTHALCESVRTIEEIIKPVCIVLYTISGFTAKILSAERTKTHILAITPSQKVYHTLNLVWGVTPVYIDKIASGFDELIAFAEDLARKIVGAKPGDKILVLGGVPTGIPQNTNFIKIHSLQ